MAFLYTTLGRDLEAIEQLLETVLTEGKRVRHHIP